MKGCYATDAEIQDFSDIRRSPAWLTFNECGHFYKRISYKEMKPATRQILLMLFLK